MRGFSGIRHRSVVRTVTSPQLAAKRNRNDPNNPQSSRINRSGGNQDIDLCPSLAVSYNATLCDSPPNHLSAISTIESYFGVFYASNIRPKARIP
jgi:hypothetical protein